HVRVPGDVRVALVEIEHAVLDLEIVPEHVADLDHPAWVAMSADGRPADRDLHGPLVVPGAVAFGYVVGVAATVELEAAPRRRGHADRLDFLLEADDGRLKLAEAGVRVAGHGRRSYSRPLRWNVVRPALGGRRLGARTIEAGRWLLYQRKNPDMLDQCCGRACEGGLRARSRRP